MNTEFLDKQMALLGEAFGWDNILKQIPFEYYIKHVAKLKENPDDIVLQHIVKDFDRISWIDKHCFVVDQFLWFMAKCGYTLQKSRSLKAEYDVFQMMEKYDKEMIQEFADIIKNDQLKEVKP
jgi:hypothetical protein